MSFTQITVSRPNFVANGQSSGNSAKRVKLEDPTGAQVGSDATVVLQPVSVVIPNSIPGEGVADLVRMCQWNQELTAIVMHLQKRVGELSQVQPKPRQKQVDSPLSSASTLAPTTPPNNPPQTLNISVGSSDFRYGIRRIYTNNLFGGDTTIKERLREVGANFDWFVEYHFLACGVNEFFVKSEFRQLFLLQLAEAGASVLEGFEPMGMNHSVLPLKEVSYIACVYSTKLKGLYARLSSATHSKDEKFLHYLRDYASEIGIILGGTIV